VTVAPGELAEVVIGSLFVAIGAAAGIAALTARPQRDPAALWFGVFCFSTVFGSVRNQRWRPRSSDGPRCLRLHRRLHNLRDPRTGRLFIEALVGPGRWGLVRRSWQLALVAACIAVTSDLVRGRPFATGWLNVPIVLVCIIVAVEPGGSVTGAVDHT
jgi:hypothetical protein